MKMKRIDFMYGVITLTAFLLLPIYLKIYGYLDQPTFISDIHKNSFYENSMEAILVYSRALQIFCICYIWHLINHVLKFDIVIFHESNCTLSNLMLPFVFPISLYCLCYSICFKIHQHNFHHI